MGYVETLRIQRQMYSAEDADADDSHRVENSRKKKHKNTRI